MTLVLTVLRGLRSRALLSVGTVVLTALAIGAAVLGPVFSEAVTNSFLISRLSDAPNSLTGVGWRFTPDAAVSERPEGPRRAAEADAVAAAAASAPDLFAAPQTYLESQRVEAFGGLTRIAAKDGACEHLEIAGACPSRPGEVMLLEGDLEFTGARFGDEVDLAELGRVVIVGSYTAPAARGDVDFWFDDQRFVSIPPAGDGNVPYQPAPWLTVSEAFDTVPAPLWSVLVDRRLVVPPDLTLEDLETAARTAASVTGTPRTVDGGLLTGQPFNDVSGVIREVQGQQATARNSIAPAVLSLVLVALALLLRLLMAAADLRLPELALASLRGLNRRRMWQLGLSEPIALLVISVPVGALGGLGMSVGLARWGLVPGLPVPLPWVAVLTGATVVLATVVVVLLAVGLVLRVTLSDQLTGVRRPRRAGRTAIVLQLALVATALAVLASKLSAGAPGDPDITDLVLPVLLAVVAGLGATRLTAATAAWWTRRRRPTRSLPSFVAARAISRRQEGTLVVLPVTAAIAICVFGAGVYDSASQWRTSVAATIAPAEVVWRSPLPIAGTVDLTHDIDPDGQYLMAATTIVTQGPSFTIADTPRLTRVAQWQRQWTPGIGTEQITDALIPHATVPTLQGERLGLTVARDTTPGESLTVELRLDSTDGEVHSAFLGPFDQGTNTVETETPYCQRGCRLTAITIGGPASVPVAMEGDLRLSDFTADGRPAAGVVEGAGWQAAPRATAGDAITGVSAEEGGLEISVDSPDERIIVQLVSGGLPAALPVVKGVDARTTAPGGAALARATDILVDPVVTSGSVPLLGPNGLLIDFTTMTIGRQIFEQQSSPVLVLARSDTPEEMITEMRARGVTLETTLAAERRILDQSAYALALRLYAVVAALVLLMALAGLFVSTAVQLPARRRDAASLRVVGVPRRSVMSAVLRELAFVLGSTALAGLAAGTLAQYVVLRTVTLGYVERLTTPALVAAIDPIRLAVLTVLAVLLFGGIALLSSALTVRGARGATLRENAR